MTLLDEAQAVPDRRGPPCAVSLLEPALRAEIEEALADASLSRTRIAEAIAARDGTTISPFILRRHARRGHAGGCSCH